MRNLVRWFLSLFKRKPVELAPAKDPMMEWTNIASFAMPRGQVQHITMANGLEIPRYIRFQITVANVDGSMAMATLQGCDALPTEGIPVVEDEDEDWPDTDYDIAPVDEADDDCHCEDCGP